MRLKEDELFELEKCVNLLEKTFKLKKETIDNLHSVLAFAKKKSPEQKISIQLPVQYKAYKFVQIYFDGKINLIKLSDDTKYIFNVAMYNRNERRIYLEKKTYTFEIKLIFNSKKIFLDKISEEANKEINRYLCEKFDQLFFEYMDAFGFNHKERYSGYNVGVDAFFKRYDIDQKQQSKISMRKHYYRYRTRILDQSIDILHDLED